MIIFGILFGVGLLAIIIMVSSILSQIPDIPSHFDNIQSTIIYDRDGNILYTIHGEENRKEIPLSEIPKYVVDATIAIEDDQFFQHHGFDVGGIVKGFLSEFLNIGSRRGGSTITQQLVKNTLLTNERTIMRKVKELLLSIQLERIFSKNEILSHYLNTIPYGSNAYGIETAARIFFNKHAQELTLAEAAILASLPQAPSRYNPYGNGKDLLMGSFDEEGNYVSGRKDVVLKRMEDLGYITSEERQQAFEEASQITFQTYREDIKHPHLVLYVKELLENKFGKDAIETGGLHVYTTIDPKLQDLAEQTITEKMQTYPEKYGATNAALLTVDTENGHILAMVGSADYFNEEIDGNVNVVFRHRLPGSSFKPFVYATAFAKGYSPATIIYDLETDFGNDYIPKNYDGSFNGPVSARRALDYSLNIPAVKMAFLAGVDNVVEQAKKMGLTDLINGDQYGTSIGLGTGEATLYQMVTAYSVLAKGGKKIAFTPILRIETSDGRMIESNEEVIPKSLEVLDPQIAYSINHILSDKSARPPGWDALQLPDQINGAKTGTSNKRIKPGKDADAIKPLDNWTLGYTTKVVTGVWVGNNDGSPLKYNASGLNDAAPIWKTIMMEATKDDELEEFPKPQGINWLRVSRRSGLLPSEYTPEEDIVAELFTSFNTPTEKDQTFLKIKIDKVSKKLPTEFTPEESIVDALVANFHSLNPSDPNWEKPVKLWAEEFIKNYDSEAIVLSELPTEYDDVHTENAVVPEIHIISPENRASVPSGMIEIHVDINAPNGVEKVEYYIDQKLNKTVTEYPYTGKIRIARSSVGDSLRIGATITDGLYLQGSDVINITISDEADSEPPETEITYPGEGAIFPANTTLTIQTTSRDNIGIESVEFFLDDRSLGKVSRPPYNLSFEIPNEIAGHSITIIAQDGEGNKAQDQVNIKVEEDSGAPRVDTQFNFPKANSTFPKGKSINFFFQISNLEQRSASSIQVNALNTDTQLFSSIYQVVSEGKASENYSFSWIPEAAGHYEFTIKTTTETERVMSSDPLQITIE